MSATFNIENLADFSDAGSSRIVASVQPSSRSCIRNQIKTHWATSFKGLTVPAPSLLSVSRDALKQHTVRWAVCRIQAE